MLWLGISSVLFYKTIPRGDSQGGDSWLVDAI